MTDEAAAAGPVAESAVAPPAPASEPVPDPKPPCAHESAVRAWLDANIRNSPVSRCTEAWNHLTAALPALVAAMKEI